MTTVNNDIDTIAAEPTGPLTLESGTQVLVERLKTRQTLLLLKIMTQGMAGSLGSLLFNEDADDSDFAANIVGGLLVAVPNAPDATVDFVKSMVRPAKFIEGARSKQEKEANHDMLMRLSDELENPELEDLMSILERVIEIEAPHIRSLGKRLALLLKVQTSSAQAKQNGSSGNGSQN